jgi:ribosomal-protein-alanine N-acetyltransferase
MIRSPPLASPTAVPFIRRAVPADVPVIVAIEREAFLDPWDAEIFIEALSYYPTTYFVAVFEGKIAGFIVGALEDTGENIYGHICNFAVSAPFQRRGIGRQLVIRLEHQFALESASGSQLEVRE